MKTQQIGASSLTTTRLAFGNMRAAGTWSAGDASREQIDAGVTAHIAAYEAGYSHFDTADIYYRGVCEKILGETLKKVAGMRDRITIATKAGIRFAGDPSPGAPHRYDFSAKHLLQRIDQSLGYLGIETLDLFYLHRPDLLMDPHEVAGAFEKMKAAGKVKEFAVSNFLPSFVSMLQKFLPMKLAGNQVEVHLGRLDCFYDGTLDQCIEQNLTPLSWSPLAGGWLAGGDLDPTHKLFGVRRNVVDVLDRIAKAHGASRTNIALAWLLKHPSKIVPIIGSANPKNIRECVKADAIDLTREQWYELLVAARGATLP